MYTRATYFEVAEPLSAIVENWSLSGRRIGATDDDSSYNVEIGASVIYVKSLHSCRFKHRNMQA